MKKLYAIALSAVLALSAAAAPLTINKPMQATFKADKVAPVTMKAQDQAVNTVAPAKVLKARKAADPESLEGTWTFLLGDYYFQTSTGETIEYDFVASFDDEGNIWFEDPMQYELPFYASFDAEKSTLTFSEGLVGQVSLQGGGTYYCFQSPFVYNYDTEDLDDQDIVADYDASAGELVFDPDNGIAWLGCTSDNIATAAGYFSIYDLEGAYSENGGEDTGEWTALGTGQFVENMIYYLFAGEENTQAVNVAVFESTDAPGVYRIDDAFQSIFAHLQQKGTTPSLVIDATDPDNVALELQSTGISARTAEETLGLMYVCSYNWYAELAELEVDPTLNCTLTKVGDDVTITFPYKSCIIYASTAQRLYQGSQFESTLKFNATAGVGNVQIDNTTAPVEYFNLQGVRVANPENGLYIRRQGNEATKVLVK